MRSTSAARPQQPQQPFNMDWAVLTGDNLLAGVSNPWGGLLAGIGAGSRESGGREAHPRPLSEPAAGPTRTSASVHKRGAGAAVASAKDLRPASHEALRDPHSGRSSARLPAVPKVDKLTGYLEGGGDRPGDRARQASVQRDKPSMRSQKRHKERTSTKDAKKKTSSPTHEWVAGQAPSKTTAVNGEHSAGDGIATELAMTAPAHVCGEHASGHREISTAPVGRKAAQLRAISLEGKRSVPEQALSLRKATAVPEEGAQGSSGKHETTSSNQRRAGENPRQKPTSKESHTAGRGITRPSRPEPLDVQAPRADSTGEEQEGRVQDEHLYPYTEARHVNQCDIFDAGMPPNARAPLPPENVATTFVVSVLSAENLPQADMVGNCDARVRVRYGTGVFETAVKHNVHDCVWENEDFEFCFPNHVLENLSKCDPTEGSHKFMSFTLMDQDTLKQQALGYANIDMLHIMNIGGEGENFVLTLHKEGEIVVDTADKQTKIHVRVCKKSPSNAEWKPPTLEETLSASHDEFGSAAEADLKRKKSTKSRAPSHGVPDDDLQVKGVDGDLDFYWREWLESRINSLGTNIFIVLAVICDIIFAIVFLTRDRELAGGAASSQNLVTDPEKLIQLVWNAMINMIFIAEITLRQMAMQGRFWTSKVNVFDFFVVWISVLAQGGYYLLEYWELPVDENVSNTLASAGVSRMISRMVMIVRFVRVLNTLRKARNVSGQMNYAIRSAVSQNKRRLQWNGFDLDLTYITSRIVAMSVPAFGQATAYRNNVHQVSRYLALRHYGRFFIFNLCDTFDSSDGVMGQYHPGMIYNTVQRVPFEDHSPPLLSEMLYFCQEAAAWMERHPQNVVCVHCKGGKGRTGVMIAALIMWTGHRRSALDALELFTFRRTSNYDPSKSLDGEEDEEDEDAADEEGVKGSSCSKFLKRLFCCGCSESSRPNQGVEGPSQIRYVHYLQAVLYNGVDPWANEPRFVHSIEFPSCKFKERSVWYISFTVRCQRILFYDSFAASGSAITISSSGHSCVSMPIKMSLLGDVRIDFYVHKHLAKPKRKLECFVTFNMCFCKGRDLLLFKKRNVDMFHKDRKHKKVPADFELRIILNTETSDSLGGRFRTLFANAGHSIALRKGDVLADKETIGDSLYLIESGFVEGVVEEEEGESHALGNCLPQTVKRSDTQGCQQLTENVGSCHRVPIMCLLGKGSVIGASQFLSKKTSMLFRVRSSEARVLRILSTSQHHDQRKSEDIPTVQTPSSNPTTPAFRKGSVVAGLKRMLTFQSPSILNSSAFSTSTLFKPSADRARLDIESLVNGVTDESDHARHRIQGIGDEDLGTFYHGFAQALVPLLDRAQVEAIRISSLRALNDAESLLAGEDSWERLRENCVKAARIPVHEKLSRVFRCKASMNGTLFPRVRVLILQNYVVLDPAFYGPVVSKKVLVLRLFHMRDVRFAQSMIQDTLILALHDASQSDDAEQGASIVECFFTFNHEERAHNLFKELSEMCHRGCDLRKGITARVHRAPIISLFAKKCGKWHTLRKNDELKAIKTSPALFVVCRGSLVLKRKGMIYRIVEQGSSYGVDNLLYCRPSGTYDAFANCDETVILELDHAAVTKLTDKDVEHYARFYYYLCVLIESDLHEALKSMFPGTWSRRTMNAFGDGARRGGEGRLADQAVRGGQQGAEEPRTINYLPTPLLPVPVCTPGRGNAV